MVDEPDVLMPAAAPANGLGALLEAALRETDRRLRARPGAPADPVQAMLASIERQLRFMAGVVASGASPTAEQANGLTLGVISVREFEADDPAYGDLLCEAAFRFKASSPARDDRVGSAPLEGGGPGLPDG